MQRNIAINEEAYSLLQKLKEQTRLSYTVIVELAIKDFARGKLDEKDN